jgi:CBS domain containing-hemolysin-like protein
LLVDGTDRPIGWVDQDAIPSDGTLDPELATPISPLLDRRTTLKDALSMLLDADVQVGIVVNRSGAVTGLVTVEAIAERMRDRAVETRTVEGVT